MKMLFSFFTQINESLEADSLTKAQQLPDRLGTAAVPFEQPIVLFISFAENVGSKVHSTKTIIYNIHTLPAKIKYFNLLQKQVSL
jgi:hypothetical protein